MKDLVIWGKIERFEIWLNDIDIFLEIFREI